MSYRSTHSMEFLCCVYNLKHFAAGHMSLCICWPYHAAPISLLMSFGHARCRSACACHAHLTNSSRTTHIECLAAYGSARKHCEACLRLMTMKMQAHACYGLTCANQDGVGCSNGQKHMAHTRSASSFRHILKFCNACVHMCMQTFVEALHIVRYLRCCCAGGAPGCAETQARRHNASHKCWHRCVSAVRKMGARSSAFDHCGKENAGSPCRRPISLAEARRATLTVPQMMFTAS